MCHTLRVDNCALQLVPGTMFPLPRHQRRKSYNGPPPVAFGPHSELQALVLEEEEEAQKPKQFSRKILPRTFPVPSTWNSYWDSRQDVPCEDREGTFRVYMAGYSGPVVFCLHGGGYTGLTWSLLAQELKNNYRVIAVDLRGHGETVTNDDGDLSSEVLCADVVSVWRKLFEDSDFPPPTVLVGHSMGGGTAVRAASSKHISSLKGVIVVDLVEGTALGSLPHMLALLKKRPPSFPSVESAVDWALTTRMSRNEEAACISVPSMLKESPEGGCYYVWRTDLLASEQYWEGWFTGLSDDFLSLTVPKLLVLVGTDRLDKTLTIGQMQGKFQMRVMPLSGHAIQEDEPEALAETVNDFLHTFRIGEKLPSFVKC